MSGFVAKVAVSKAVYSMDKPYDYLIPRELEESLRPGMRVLVPFGNGNRGTDGMVLEIARRDGPLSLKSVVAQLDDAPVLDEKGLRLALWLRERYFCTLCDAVKTMLPAGLWFSLRDLVCLRNEADRETAYQAAGQSKSAQRLVELLFSLGGRAEMEQIRAAFGPADPNPAIRQLVEAGAAEVISSAQRGVGDKREAVAQLAVPAEEALSRVLPRRKSAPLRCAVTELLCAVGMASVKELCYFTGASSATLKSLEKSGILTLSTREVFRRPSLEETLPAPPPELSAAQEAAFQGLDELCRSGKSAAALLYGVTGSGKTQVYIRLILRTLERGRTALVLVPEIALTPQLLRIFAAHFGDEIAVLHSSLRATERYDEWKRIQSGKARVVVGTRSAVFAPLDNLGLIVLDEEQEASYKSENTPRYHAREVAKFRCVQHGALLLLGSATPLVESMYYAQTGVYHLFSLDRRYNDGDLPQVEVVDMKAELRGGNGGALSAQLRRALEETLARGEQAILLLNRRGASRMVSCGECGHVPECPRCSVKLTHHSVNGRLMCHYCGHSQPLPVVCPLCGGELHFIGLGTQKLEEELGERFPGAALLRMDADSVSATQTHGEILRRFQRGEASILLGTQMVAKGLDFENVTLVGVISADLSLYLDDFRAGERTFSLITQAVGRAGRGAKAGRAVIQTLTPDNEVISAAAGQDYDRFYQEEVRLRRLRGYPPFQDMLTLHASGPNETGVLRVLGRLRRALEPELAQWGEPFQLLGPAPEAVAKVSGRYRYCLTFCGKNTAKLRALVAHVLRAAGRDRENRGVALHADPNPQN